MKILSKMIAASALLVACVAAIATAQGPGRGQPRDDQRRSDPDDLVTRMMAFDKNNDGKLTKEEVTDERLLRLVDRADTDKDGVVTKAELTALASREQLSNAGGGPGGFGPPGGGGPGGPRGMGGPPRPGEILPAILRQRLNLNAKQEKQLADLQKHVDVKLEEILTADQRNQLKSMRMGAPGGFGPPGGPGGRRGGGPGGGRPGGGPPPPPPDESQ
jgi:Spy/CpxP family protein refolding chaperone